MRSGVVATIEFLSKNIDFFSAPFNEQSVESFQKWAKRNESEITPLSNAMFDVFFKSHMPHEARGRFRRAIMELKKDNIKQMYEFLYGYPLMVTAILSHEKDVIIDKWYKNNNINKKQQYHHMQHIQQQLQKFSEQEDEKIKYVFTTVWYLKYLAEQIRRALFVDNKNHEALCKILGLQLGQGTSVLEIRNALFNQYSKKETEIDALFKGNQPLILAIKKHHIMLQGYYLLKNNRKTAKKCMEAYRKHLQRNESIITKNSDSGFVGHHHGFFRDRARAKTQSDNNTHYTMPTLA